ncbi:MAG: flavocytochrome c [Sutterella sp.]|nr:flavocytochrome c [Sutterella sp.]
MALIQRRHLIGAAGMMLFGLSGPAAAAASPGGSADVIVVGGGGAGLSAAVTAAQAGASVLLLEKLPAIGGNTLRASGLFNAADPERQKPLGIEDSPDWHYKQMLASGGPTASPEVVRRFVDEALPTLHWLEGLGVRFMPQTVATWGAEWPRGHKPVLPRGQAYIRTLSAELMRRGGRILTRTAVTDLLTDNAGRVTGVSAEIRHPDGRREVKRFAASRGVILASGGFAANADMVARHVPALRDMPTDNSPGNTGDLLAPAARIGARIQGLDFIQCVPGAPAGRSFQVRLDLDSGRSLLVDADGERFVDEDRSRDILARAILSKPRGTVWIVTDDAAVSSYDMVSRKDIYKGLQTRDALRAGTIAELAGRMGVSAARLEETIRGFQAESEGRRGKCARVRCVPLTKAPFWASRVHLNVHTTMGGLVITPDAEVVGTDGQPIPGLFAAGEVTGNVHGENRIGGNGVSDAVVFGRIAGQSVMKQSR